MSRRGGGRMRRHQEALARGGLTLMLAGLVGAAAPVGPATADTSPTPPTGETATRTQAGLSLDSMSPGTLRPGQDLQVTVTVTAGDEPIRSGSDVALWLRHDVLQTRYSVSAWSTAGHSERLGTRLSRVPITSDIPAHAGRRIRITVPAEDIPLSDQSSSFGPRGVGLVLTDPQSNQAAVAHTFLVWYPANTHVRKVAMSVIVPVTAGAPAPTTGLPRASRLAQETGPQGRLTSLLTAGGRTGVTFAVDPSLLVSGGSEPAQVTTWRSRLLDRSTRNQTLLLPSADPDVAALAHANAGSLLATARGRAKTQGAGLKQPLTTVAMPAAGRLDQQTAQLLKADGYTCAVLRSDAQPTTQEQPVTPSGRSRITFPGLREPTLCGLLADDTLSDILAGPTADQPDIPTGGGAVQQLLAESAAIAEQDPSTPRQLLAVAPRQWAPGSTGRAQMNALLGQPWVSPARLSGLINRPVPRVDRSTPTIDPTQQTQELSAAGIVGVVDQLHTVNGIAEAATKGRDDIIAAMQQPALGVVSQAWRGDRPGWQQAQEAFASAVNDERRKVRVVPGSSINQVSQDVRLPVTVANDLDQPVEVHLRATPTTNLLRVVKDDEPVRVAGHSRTVAYVAVRGVGSGDAQVRMSVLTRSGFVLDDADAVRVRVRADWENRAAAVTGAVFLAILVAGVVRTLRRGRTRADTIDPTTGESSS